MSWQPFTFSTPVLMTGNTSATLFTAPVSGYYAVCLYAEPTATSALVSSVLTIGFTSNGTARTLSQPALSLASMSNTMSNYQVIYADGGTAVTYSMTGLTSGGVRLHIGWKPQGS